MSHAILSPSGASRWLVCTPSARFEEKFPESKSKFADEGTLAHSLGELLIRQKLGWIKKAAYKKLLFEIEANESYSPPVRALLGDFQSMKLKVSEREALWKSEGLGLLDQIERQRWRGQLSGPDNGWAGVLQPVRRGRGSRLGYVPGSPACHPRRQYGP